jgi:hypothetical protein
LGDYGNCPKDLVIRTYVRYRQAALDLIDEQQLEALRAGVAVDCAHLSALQASVGRQLLEVARSGAWGGPGIKSIEHWASMALGLAPATTKAHLAVAEKLEVLPVIDRAVREGRLSFDKAKAVVPVATTATQERWMDLAEQATVTGLQRIVAAWRKVEPDGSAAEPDDAHPKRRLFWTGTGEGLEKLTALLTPEEAAIVKAAIANAEEEAWRTTSKEDRAEQPAGARAVDALVAVAETAMAAGPTPCEGGDRNRVNLIIDLDLLLGRSVDGRCAIEGSKVPLALSEAEMLCCDAIIRPTFIRGLDIVATGHDQRLANRAQRRALRTRDGGCRFPGCAATRFLDAHHVDHWIRGGRTTLANLLLLCRFHHRLHHRGGYTIHATEKPGEFRFYEPGGDEIGLVPDRAPPDLATTPALTGIEPTWFTPHAKDAGTRLDLDLIVGGLLWAAREPDPNRRN